MQRNTTAPHETHTQAGPTNCAVRDQILLSDGPNSMKRGEVVIRKDSPGGYDRFGRMEIQPSAANLWGILCQY